MRVYKVHILYTISQYCDAYDKNTAKEDARFVTLSQKMCGNSHAGIRIEPAIHGDCGAGDKAGIALVAKEQQRAFQFLRFAEALHRRSGKDLARARRGRAVVVPKQRLVLVGREKARGDRVDADAAVSKMHRHKLRKVLHGRFRRGVGGESPGAGNAMGETPGALPLDLQREGLKGPTSGSRF